MKKISFIIVIVILVTLTGCNSILVAQTSDVINLDTSNTGNEIGNKLMSSLQEGNIKLFKSIFSNNAKKQDIDFNKKVATFFSSLPKDIAYVSTEDNEYNNKLFRTTKFIPQDSWTSDGIPWVNGDDEPPIIIYAFANNEIYIGEQVYGVEIEYYQHYYEKLSDSKTGLQDDPYWLGVFSCSIYNKNTYTSLRYAHYSDNFAVAKVDVTTKAGFYFYP